MILSQSSPGLHNRLSGPWVSVQTGNCENEINMKKRRKKERTKKEGRGKKKEMKEEGNEKRRPAAAMEEGAKGVD